MINCMSIRCSLAFAPYLLENASEFIAHANTAGRLVRQGGFGMTFHSDGDLVLHHQNRESRLTRADAAHYQATIDFRRQAFEVVRMADEVVLSTVGNLLLISHPQSDLWLDSAAVSVLVGALSGYVDSAAIDGVTYSVGGGRLMLSDQHNGRWVLLGTDHTSEMERRLKDLSESRPALNVPTPPTISLKGVAIHLQSAFVLVDALRQFSAAGQFDPFTEVIPTYSLAVARSAQGMEIADSLNRVAVTKREAAKWTDIIDAELERLKARQFERGAIRTVAAFVDGGKWVLQWGDEVFLRDDLSGVTGRGAEAAQRIHPRATSDRVRIGTAADYMLALDTVIGACVALTPDEARLLTLPD